MAVLDGDRHWALSMLAFPTSSITLSTEISHSSICPVAKAFWEQFRHLLLPSAWVHTANYLVPVVTLDSISRNARQLENIFFSLIVEKVCTVTYLFSKHRKTL